MLASFELISSTTASVHSGTSLRGVILLTLTPQSSPSSMLATGFLNPFW